MATERITIQFDVERETDIPRVGHAKRVRVNGKMETLYVRSVDVIAQRPRGWKDTMFRGTAVLTTRDGLSEWRAI